MAKAAHGTAVLYRNTTTPHSMKGRLLNPTLAESRGQHPKNERGWKGQAADCSAPRFRSVRALRLAVHSVLASAVVGHDVILRGDPSRSMRRMPLLL